MQPATTSALRVSMPSKSPTMARAIWKGQLELGRQKLAVKLYSAVEDRTIHFHLLHAKDLAPVEQHIVRKDNREEVKREDIRKAIALSRQTAVILQPDDLEKLVPAESRDIEITRFVSPAVLGDQWFERPYYVGPDGDASSYFALAAALERKQVIGIARWVMRKKRYVGALSSVDGFLTMTTPRRADLQGHRPGSERVEAGPATGLFDRSGLRSVTVAERISRAPVQADRGEGPRREDQVGPTAQESRSREPRGQPACQYRRGEGEESCLVANDASKRTRQPKRQQAHAFVRCGQARSPSGW